VRVQRVVMPVTEAESWTLLDDQGVPVAPVESYLAYLSALERSPNTVRAYCPFTGRVQSPWAKGDAPWGGPG
jgi:hypothetical protein